jgi:cell division protein ZapA
MAQVSVTIAGKQYRMACGDGEEAHLEGLAGILDERISQLHSAFGEIGDMRLHVMAALTLVDELDEAKKRIAALEAETVSLRASIGAGDQQAEAAETRVAEAVSEAAERIERIARGINPPPQGER